MKKQSLVMVVGCVTLLLTGCMSPEAKEARRQAIEQSDHQECLRLGFKQGSDGYGNCRLKIREIRAQERAAANQAYPRVGIGFGYGGGRHW